MAKWNLDFYQGEDGYSEGAIENELLEMVKSEKTIEEILASDSRWSVLYHLSPLRENILNWYPFKADASILEIGAGCGAITGLLCRKGKSVTSVELTKIRSEINYERHKKYDNWELITGNFHNIDFSQRFDYIILNGVFEYAASFTGGDNPYETFLEQLKPLLSSQGIVLIAIENRLGLKYFNGAREDHTGEIFSGLNNYENVDFVRTFSRNHLTRLVTSSGFKHQRYYYPSPDYKFVEMVYTDDSWDLLDYNTAEMALDGTRAFFFNQKNMVKTLADEGLCGQFANSFLLEIAFEEEAEGTEKVIFAKTSNYRKSEYAILTKIIEKDRKREVYKEGLSQEAKEHLWRMAEHQGQSLAHITNAEMKTTDAGIEMAYLNGEPFVSTIIRLLEENKKAAFEDIIRTFYSRLCQGGEKTSDFYSSQFVAVFGKEKSDDVFCCRENLNIDLLFSNIFKEDDEYLAIDYEWYFDFSIPVEFVMWRVLSMLHRNYAIVRRNYTFDALLALIDVTKPEINELFEKWDRHFVYSFVGSSLLDNYKHDQVYLGAAVNEAANNLEISSTLYYDLGTGYSEEYKIRKNIYLHGDSFHVEFQLGDYADGICGLRWDPCEEACIVSDIIINGELEIEAINSFEEQDADYFFLTADPQFVIRGMFLTDMKITISGKLKRYGQLSSFQDILTVKEQEHQETMISYNNLAQCYEEILNSNSWKITKPLRNLMKK